MIHVPVYRLQRGGCIARFLCKVPDVQNPRKYQERRFVPKNIQTTPAGARNDPKALATALINLVENPIALKRMKEAPNPLKEIFRWDRIADQYIEIYRKVLNKE